MKTRERILEVVLLLGLAWLLAGCSNTWNGFWMDVHEGTAPKANVHAQR